LETFVADFFVGRRNPLQHRLPSLKLPPSGTDGSSDGIIATLVPTMEASQLSWLQNSTILKNIDILYPDFF
jgi:hypothetical protein